MFLRNVLPWFTGVFLMCCGGSNAMAFDHTHKGWSKVLGQYLVRGSFNYRDLKKTPDAGGSRDFQDYLRQLEAVTQKEYDTFSKVEQMAFLINAYNAFTVKLILDHYPVESIRDIGGFFKSPWSIQFFSLLEGKIRSLDPIEHDYLRPIFKDYRIHGAVNCASKSCPELRAEAFVPDRLGEQLDDQMAKWLLDHTRNRVDPSTQIIYLSKIFDWYGKDFEQWAGGVPNVLIKHGAKIYKPSLDAGYKIRYTDYDWTLNESPSRH